MKKCLGCGDPAISYTGHIHTEIGKLTAGWCSVGGYCAKTHKKPDRVNNCSSTNPHSCYGKYKYSDIEFRTEPTKEDFIQHAQAEEFSRQVDFELMGIGRRGPSIPDEKKGLFARLFGF